MRRGARVVVTVLVLVNGVLIAVAVKQHDAKPSAAPPQVVIQTPPTTSPTTSQSGTPSPLTDAELLTARAGNVDAASTFEEPLFTSHGKTAWRALFGCKTSPALSVLTPGALDWVKLTQPDYFLLRIQMTGAKTGWAVGANYTCTLPRYYTTTDGGKTWKQGPLGHLWYATPAGIESPSGTPSTPCGKKTLEPISFAPGNKETALIVCRHGVLRTTDGGASWHSAGKVTTGRAAAVALTPSGRGVLLMAEQPGCQGALVLTTSNAGRRWQVGQCLLVAVPPFGLSLNEDGSGTVYSFAGEYETTDFGATWN